MSQFADGRRMPRMWQEFRDGPGTPPAAIPANAQVIETRQPLVIDDCATSPLLPREWVEAYGLRSCLIVPMLRQEGVIGVMTLDYTDRPARFQDWQQDLAQAIAGQLALALENTRLYDEAQERLKQTQTLLAVGQVVSQPGSIDRLLRAAASEVAKAFEADMVGVYLMDPVKQKLMAAAGYHVPKELMEFFTQRPLALERSPALLPSWREGRAVWSSDVKADERFDPDWVRGAATPLGDGRAHDGPRPARRRAVPGVVAHRAAVPARRDPAGRGRRRAGRARDGERRAGPPDAEEAGRDRNPALGEPGGFLHVRSARSGAALPAPGGEHVRGRHRRPVAGRREWPVAHAAGRLPRAAGPAGGVAWGAALDPGPSDLRGVGRHPSRHRGRGRRNRSAAAAYPARAGAAQEPPVGAGGGQGPDDRRLRGGVVDPVAGVLAQRPGAHRGHRHPGRRGDRERAPVRREPAAGRGAVGPPRAVAGRHRPARPRRAARRAARSDRARARRRQHGRPAACRGRGRDGSRAAHRRRRDRRERAAPVSVDRRRSHDGRAGGRHAAARGRLRRGVRAAGRPAGRAIGAAALLGGRAAECARPRARRDGAAQRRAAVHRGGGAPARQRRAPHRAGPVQRAALRGAHAGLRRAGGRPGSAGADREAPRAGRDGLRRGPRLQQPAGLGAGTRPAPAPPRPGATAAPVAAGHRALGPGRRPDGAAAAGVHADPARPAAGAARPQPGRARRARHHAIALEGRADQPRHRDRVTDPAHRGAGGAGRRGRAARGDDEPDPQRAWTRCPREAR